MVSMSPLYFMSCGEVVYVTKGRDDQYQGRRYFTEGGLSGVSPLSYYRSIFFAEVKKNKIKKIYKLARGRYTVIRVRRLNGYDTSGHDFNRSRGWWI